MVEAGCRSTQWNAAHCSRLKYAWRTSIEFSRQLLSVLYAQWIARLTSLRSSRHAVICAMQPAVVVRLHLACVASRPSIKHPLAC
jgi:hypothetical protein